MVFFIYFGPILHEFRNSTQLRVHLCQLVREVLTLGLQIPILFLEMIELFFFAWTETHSRGSLSICSGSANIRIVTHFAYVLFGSDAP